MEENKPINGLEPQVEEDIKKKTVLIVEDEDISFEILSTMLQEKYEILRAHNGEEGLQIIRKDAKDLSLVLLDLMMPIMDGGLGLK